MNMDVKTLIEEELRKQRELILMFNHFDQEFSSLLDDMKATAREGILDVIFGAADGNLFRFKQFAVLNLLKEQRAVLTKVCELCNHHLDRSNKSSVFEMDISGSTTSSDVECLPVMNCSHVFRPQTCYASDTDASSVSSHSDPVRKTCKELHGHVPDGSTTEDSGNDDDEECYRDCGQHIVSEEDTSDNSYN